MAMPVVPPPTPMPVPMAPVPMSVPVMVAPMDLLRLEMINFVLCGDCGFYTRVALRREVPAQHSW